MVRRFHPYRSPSAKRVVNLVLAAAIFALLNSALSSRGDNPSAISSSGDDQKTPAQWLEVIKAQTIACKRYEKDHPEETTILYGATQVLLSTASDKIPQSFDQWPVEYQSGYKAYAAWWKSDGENAFSKWRQAGFPVSSDKYYLVFNAVAMASYLTQDMKKDENKDLVAYVNGIVKRGNQLFLQGCSGGLLTASDLAEFRLFAMYTGQIWEPPVQVPSFEGWMKVNYNAGDPAYDFVLPRLEEILARPTYSDANPYDEMNLFRPSIMTRLLQIMTGYEAVDDSQKGPGNLAKAKPYDGQFKDPVTLSSFRGKKPVLFMCDDADDTWDWSGRVAPLWQPLYQAVKDKVEIFFIHTTVHDEVMPATFASNFTIPGSRAFHSQSLEERARTAKLCYMLYPTLSIPYLMDDPGEHVLNAYQADGGSAWAFLVDLNGKISFFNWQSPECRDYMAIDGGLGGGPSYALTLRHEATMNLVESNLKTLLDAGGVWNKEMKMVISNWKVTPTTLENVQLTAVDASRGQITTLNKDKTPITITVDGQTRIQQGAERKNFADLKVNQTVSIYYQQNGSTTSTPVARLIFFGGPLESYWEISGNWVPAMVQSVDLNKGAIIAKMTLHPGESKGMAFWKTSSPELIMSLGSLATSIPAAYNDLIARQDQPLTLHIDRATELFLDGACAQLSDLKQGDALGIELPTDFKADDVWPHFIRAYRY